MDICVDFDGTCVAHEFPGRGKDISAVPVLKELVANGHNLILFTMRSNVTDNQGFSEEVPEVHNGAFLDDAVNWFKENEIPLHGIQENPQQKQWTTSPKAYGQLYIDDAALGTPLIHGDHKRPYVCWKSVREYLVERNIIKISVEEMYIKNQQQVIMNIVEECRIAEKRVKGFGLARLDDIAKDCEMPAELKEQVKKMILDPDLKFKVNFTKAE
jgi:hypothetical protein